jgi:hypothetical protein
MSTTVSSAPTRRRGRSRALAAADALGARLGIDRVELAALVALAGLSLAILFGLLLNGRPLSGADGLLAADQLQYFAWIRDAAHHGLIGNRFDMVDGPRAFLHPMFGLSGLVHAVTGISVPLSYLLWKPLAVAVTFAGALAYVRRLVPAGGRRHVALLIVLFAVMPASAFVAWTGWGGNPRQFTFDFIAGEMWSGQWLWGYLPTAIAVFLMPLTLLAYERGRTGWAAAGAFLCCWLQPWQGATLAIVTLAADGWRWRRDGVRPGWRALAVPLAAAVPSVYYLLLSRLDPAWRLADDANAAGAQATWTWPWWAIVIAVAPLAVPAALAYRLPAPTWQDVAVRVWPFAVLVVFLAPVGTFPYHSFQGLAIPLGILAVLGVASVRPHLRRRWVVLALALLIVPGTLHRAEVALNSVQSGGDPFWVWPGEVEALKALEADPRAGGVLAPVYAGYMIPARTGRETWVGALSWTPDWERRVRRADAVFEGRVRGQAVRDLALASNARWLFGDCRPGLADLTADLRPILASVRRYGCATVWELRERPGMAAAGVPDA